LPKKLTTIIVIMPKIARRGRLYQKKKRNRNIKKELSNSTSNFNTNYRLVPHQLVAIRAFFVL